MSENEHPQSRVPLQETVSSASELPASPLRISVSPQEASARYVKQFQALIERQRQTFNEERALWNTERTELHDKIAHLERSLRRYHPISSGQTSSPFDKSISPFQSHSSFLGVLSKDGSSPTSATTTGDEVWRGPKSDVKPTRTFSDPTTQFSKPGDRRRLPSIAEDTTCGQKDSSNMQTGLHKPSVSGAGIDKNLDGINFKSGILSQVSTKKVMTPQSPSPRTSSPSRLSPRTIQLPPFKLEAPVDPYTKDAGHTPLVRRASFNTDGASSDGDATTPTQPEMERLPLEPHASRAKLPSERSDSYFPIAEEESRDENHDPRDKEDKSRDEDPELKGPLGLDNGKNEGEEDKHFLNELDSKLLKAAKSDPLSPSGTDLGSESSLEHGKDFEQPEHEPKLRIKKSMNFGSAFGAKPLGRASRTRTHQTSGHGLV